MNIAGEIPYESSRVGYSGVGQLVTWSSFPWLLVVAATVYAPSGLEVVPYLALALAPSLVWWFGRLVGPGRMPWFYRDPGACLYTPRAVELKSRSMGSRGQASSVLWADIAGVNVRGRRVWIVGRDGHVLEMVGSDLRWLKPLDRPEELSFAESLVAYRPTEFVLDDETVEGKPAGARRRESGEAPSRIAPRPLTRQPQIILGLYIACIFLLGIVAAGHH